ncbi:hypothetical protein ACQKDS_12245 [Serratia sp. NPDC078593]|uniref:hypothetical protein n=1 Tax=unclassified Serratia (in: enterobacteria) TaxID=2647522 RepID=UPI0037D51BEF
MDEWEELFSGLPVRHSERESKLIEFCEKYRVNILSAMPWVASEIAAQSGFSDLFNLVYCFGGRKIHMPPERKEFYKIYNISMTEHSYQRLYKKSDVSGYLELPSAWGVFMAIRRAAMQLAMKEDVPTMFLTKTFGVTMRNIRLIKAKRDVSV